MKKLIMYCDTGGDDAAAISLAIASNEIELLGVTTCMGNLPLWQTYRNSRELIHHYGLQNLPVLKGSEGPLTCEYWVGTETDHPLPVEGLSREMYEENKKDAVEWMAETLKNSDEKVTLIPLAPLTNIAKLMLAYPDLVREKVDEIIVMGGGTISNPRPYAGATGVTTGIAELNIYADPEAAQVVFAFGVPVVLCGLDVCHNAYILNRENNMLRAIGNRAAKVFADITDDALTFANKGDIETAQAVIYDSVPVVYALYPHLFKGGKASIDVVLSEELCRGFTVCEFENAKNVYRSKSPKIHTVLMDADREGYLQAVKTILEQYE